MSSYLLEETSAFSPSVHHGNIEIFYYEFCVCGLIQRQGLSYRKHRLKTKLHSVLSRAWNDKIDFHKHISNCIWEWGYQININPLSPSKSSISNWFLHYFRKSFYVCHRISLFTTGCFGCNPMRKCCYQNSTFIYSSNFAIPVVGPQPSLHLDATMWNWEVFFAQYNRWCSTVAYKYIQCLHIGKYTIWKKDNPKSNLRLYQMDPWW